MILLEWAAEFVFDELLTRTNDKGKELLRRRRDSRELARRLDGCFAHGIGARLVAEQDNPGGLDAETLRGFLREHAVPGALLYWQTGDRHAAARHRDSVIRRAYAHMGEPSAAQKRDIHDLILGLYAVVGAYLQDSLTKKDQYLLASIGDALQKEMQGLHDKMDALLLKGTFAQRMEDLREQRKENYGEFDYRRQIVPFRGRKDELDALGEFCDAPEDFLWWAVTGAGGMGKSRFVLEFIEGHRYDTQWMMAFCPVFLLKPDELFGFTDVRYDKNVLLVIDYVSACGRELGEWMLKLRKMRKLETDQKLRLLLIERDAPEAERNPLWYDQLLQGIGGLPQCQYEHQEQGKFLRLPSPDSEDVAQIIGDYVEHTGKARPDGKTLDALAGQLASIDPKQSRPLYALFLADAFAEHGDEINHWNIERLNEYIYQRERRRIASVLNEADTEADSVEAAMGLIALATMAGEPIGEATAREYLPEQLEAVRGCFAKSQKRFLQALEQLCPGGGAGMVAPYTPDIPGEYIVLRQMAGIESAGKASALEDGLWHRFGKGYAWFLMQLCQDFMGSDVLDGKVFKVLFAEPADLNPPADIIHAFALYVAAFSVPSTNNSLFPEIKKRVFSFARKVISLRSCIASHIIAMGLVNLAAEVDEASATRSISLLEELYFTFAGDRDITLEYAKGLVILSTKLDEQDMISTISKLEEIYSKFIGDQEIANILADGLLYLSIKQDIQGLIHTISKLEELHNEFTGEKEIAYNCAKVLSKLSVMQDGQALLGTISKLERISNTFPDIQEIALEYASGLMNLSNTQDIHGCIETVAKLERLYSKFEGNRDIAMQYTIGLLNLSIKQNGQSPIDTKVKLRGLYYKFTDDRDMALEYAKGLVYLSGEQDEQGIIGTIAKLEGLYHTFTDDREIALEYAKGLVHLSIKTQNNQIETPVEKLDEISKQFRTDEELAFYNAVGIFVVWTKQKDDERMAYGNHLDTLLERFQSDPDIERALALRIIKFYYRNISTEGQNLVYSKIAHLWGKYGFTEDDFKE